MPVENINEDTCTGCGECVKSCPMDVIRMDEAINKAVIRYPEDCMLCDWCELDCPENAIYVSPVKSAPLILSWG